MNKKILITKEVFDLKNRNFTYYPLMRTINSINDNLFREIEEAEIILIASIKGAYALSQNLQFSSDLANLIYSKSFITIGSRSYDFLKEGNYNILCPAFKNFAHFISNWKVNQKIIYLSGFNTVVSNDNLELMKRIIIYRSYINPFPISYLKILNSFHYIFVYSKEVAIYLNSLPNPLDTTFVSISARVAESFTKGQKTLYASEPSEEAMFSLVTL